ncbi:unnamed protein product [Pleuronectes platessa]|uniref:Uncharacterized protein n=1 Tax=Pleuronectes platessa TaxID=8262 RepID=A0A9N7VNZ2_PLEPL|nr:unnamed protein product [Pleuronectes platessa]
MRVDLCSPPHPHGLSTALITVKNRKQGGTLTVWAVHRLNESNTAEVLRDQGTPVPLSKAPYSPNICSPGAVHGRSLLCVSCLNSPAVVRENIMKSVSHFADAPQESPHREVRVSAGA